MRSGVVISAIFHVVLVALVMLSTPRQFDAATPAVEVDLVRADEIDLPKDAAKPEEPKPEKNLWDFPPAEKKPLIQLPDFSRKGPATSPPSRPPAASKQAAAAPQPAPAPAQQAPSNSQQAALTPPPSPSQSSIAAEKPSGPPPTASPQAPPSVFDAASIPMLMDLPNSQVYGFDSESILAANLSGDERAAFKTHLRKCWKLPEGVSPAQSTRIVLRVYLRRDGALASDPVLIEASASKDGPAVLLAAKRALQECQPFAFLPAEKYGEWKVLDLSFSPREMAGG